MCTAISYRTQDHYFGRNLDLERSYQETVTITPRGFPFRFCPTGAPVRHFAMIGMAHAQEGYPLYYEAVNEAGLAMAGLNFPDNAWYGAPQPEWDNVPPFDLIPWILGQCGDLAQARAALERVCVVDIPFSKQLQSSPLHWMVSDQTGSLVAESVQEGLRLYENPVGVLTNNPPFDMMLHRLNDYMGLSSRPPENRFAPELEPDVYSRGMGALGLPGDLSSASRFVRAAFTLRNSVCDESEAESVSQFFHILRSVEQTRGCVQLADGSLERTIYSCCCNTDRGIYYYTTYDNSQITAVDLHREQLDGEKLICYPLIQGQHIRMQN